MSYEIIYVKLHIKFYLGIFREIQKKTWGKFLVKVGNTDMKTKLFDLGHRLGYSDEQLGDKRPNHRT